MNKKLMVLSGLGLMLTPFLASAATFTACTGITSGSTASSSTLTSLLCTIGNLLNSVVPVLIALGVVYFVWGVISYVISSDEEAKKSGRDRMIYGIIGLAVIVGLWGLVGLLGNTFGINNPTNSVTLPTVPIGTTQ